MRLSAAPPPRRARRRCGAASRTAREELEAEARAAGGRVEDEALAPPALERHGARRPRHRRPAAARARAARGRAARRRARRVHARRLRSPVARGHLLYPRRRQRRAPWRAGRGALHFAAPGRAAPGRAGRGAQHLHALGELLREDTGLEKLLSEAALLLERLLEGLAHRRPLGQRGGAKAREGDADKDRRGGARRNRALGGARGGEGQAGGPDEAEER